MLNIYLVNGGWIDPEYLDGYLWSGGYYLRSYVVAETPGKAKARWLMTVNDAGYDYEWTDKISVRKIASGFDCLTAAEQWLNRDDAEWIGQRIKFAFENAII